MVSSEPDAAPDLPAHTSVASDSESDFGSFGSFEQDETEHGTPAGTSPPVDYDDPKERIRRVNELLDVIFEQPARQQPHSGHEGEKGASHNDHKSQNHLLSDRSSELYTRLADIPRLRPPNWTRLVVRHRLLISLGIPVNLDEISSAAAGPEPTADRRKSVHAPAVEWAGLQVPEYAALGLDDSSRRQILEDTPEVLDRMETENMEHSSLAVLEAASADTLRAKLAHYRANKQQLQKTASVWRHELAGLQSDFEIYELVVQNLIGHSQRLQREEILQRKR